jgi:hypothetical protein
MSIMIIIMLKKWGRCISHLMSSMCYESDGKALLGLSQSCHHYLVPVSQTPKSIVSSTLQSCNLIISFLLKLGYGSQQQVQWPDFSVTAWFP